MKKCPWYTSTAFIVICLGTIGPLALPLVWIHPRWNIYLKVGLTVGVCIAGWWMWISLTGLLKELHQVLTTSGISL